MKCVRTSSRLILPVLESKTSSMVRRWCGGNGTDLMGRATQSGYSFLTTFAGFFSSGIETVDIVSKFGVQQVWDEKIEELAEFTRINFVLNS